VLSDIVKLTSARARTPVDVGFQSVAGTSRALACMVGLDVDGILDLANGFDGLYFETGQGSEVTNGAAAGVDMMTLEARTYGVARLIQRHTGKWTIVNDVAGFIGPEVFRSSDQLLRACLEDSVMGKLHGLTMGLDVCATFHMGIAPAVLASLTETIVEQAAPAYLMAVAGNADPMLGYMTTSFRQHPRLRAATGKRAASAMHARLGSLGLGARSSDHVPALYARYLALGGDSRSDDQLQAEAARKIGLLRSRGWELGSATDIESERRIEAIYRNARRALYAEMDGEALRDAAPDHLTVRSEARDRDDYLSHPRHGERILAEDAARVRAAYPSRRPRIQIVVSDGLNANAVAENLRQLLPPLRAQLAARGIEVGSTDVVIRNGRVRAGYHIGGLLDVEGVVHLIGERPGTGLNALSAYITYGRDARGRSRWSPGLDHSCTTAICGIHPRGKPPEAAVEEIAATVQRMLQEHRSGVAFQASPAP
jgi:ethanolamine ammonia-lyase large subunit